LTFLILLKNKIWTTLNISKFSGFEKPVRNPIRGVYVVDEARVVPVGYLFWSVVTHLFSGISGRNVPKIRRLTMAIRIP